jgi:hypothetical protein
MQHTSKDRWNTCKTLKNHCKHTQHPDKTFAIYVWTHIHIQINTLTTYVWKTDETLGTDACNICNIRIKHLQHISKTFETFKMHICNMHCIPVRPLPPSASRRRSRSRRRGREGFRARAWRFSLRWRRLSASSGGRAAGAWEGQMRGLLGWSTGPGRGVRMGRTPCTQHFCYINDVFIE